MLLTLFLPHAASQQVQLVHSNQWNNNCPKREFQCHLSIPKQILFVIDLVIKSFLLYNYVSVVLLIQKLRLKNFSVKFNPTVYVITCTSISFYLFLYFLGEY